MRARFPVFVGFLALGLVWWGAQNLSPRLADSSQPGPKVEPAQAPAERPAIAEAPFLPPARPVAAPEAPDLVLAPVLALQAGALPWEKTLARINETPGLSDAGRAREILRILEYLPEESLETATREAADRLPDPDYAAALPLLINPLTHGRILQELFEDLLGRPDPIALPALLAVARTPGHPFAPSARDTLGLLLGKSFGTDWPRWEAEIRRAGP